MPNIFTSTNTEFLGQLVLDQFVATLSPLKAFTLSATAQQLNYRGETVKVLSVGTSSAALDFSTTYSMQDSQATGIDVTLDKHKYVSLELPDSNWRDSALLETERFARSKGYALGNAILTDVMSFVSSSFRTETRTVAKSNAFSASAIVDLSNYADSINWPQMDRSLLLTPTQHSYLRRDPVITATYSYGSSEAIKTGQVPSVDTFSSIYKSSVVPSTTVGLCAVPNALVFASRVVTPSPNHNYNEVKILSDPETGLSITQLSWYNPEAQSQRVVWTCEYGYAIGNSKGAFLLV
jgi:hypothetical protein